jgi:hypothetical protein
VTTVYPVVSGKFVQKTPQAFVHPCGRAAGPSVAEGVVIVMAAEAIALFVFAASVAIALIVVVEEIKSGTR